LLKLSVSDGKPVIYASFNRRLGIFGFANFPILRGQKSLNNGMRDQRLVFQWIKDNIAVFGGDPHRITVYGCSAAGTLTSMHPMVYGGKYGIPYFLPDRQSKLVGAGKFAKGRLKLSKPCPYSLIDVLGISMVFGWTQDDGSTNVALPSMVQTEDDIIPTLKMYAYALNPEQLSKLFLLYPAEDFEKTWIITK
jgi:hypothetical protein